MACPPQIAQSGRAGHVPTAILKKEGAPGMLHALPGGPARSPGTGLPLQEFLHLLRDNVLLVCRNDGDLYS